MFMIEYFLKKDHVSTPQKILPKNFNLKFLSLLKKYFFTFKLIKIDF